MTSSISAWYPLVRKRSDFSTRFGVSRSPSRSGSSPSSRSTRAISSCIGPLYCMGLLMLAAVRTFPAAAQAPAPGDADAHYAAREHLPDAQAAAAIWQRRLEANPHDFDAAWKLARAAYYLGNRLPEDARGTAFETGMAAARRAIAARPDRPEGYFWLAATMGGLAELRGPGAGLRYRGAIR